MVIAQVLEGRVLVNFREAAIENGDAQAFAVDALVNEVLSAKTDQLVG